jgi:beta-glucosidase
VSMRSKYWEHIALNPRWGRNMGGAGEDPYLGSCVAEAQVRGFQGSIPAELADPQHP